jgi:hypothetical protein
VTRKQLVPAAMARLAELAESSPSDHRTLLAQIAKVAHVLPVERRELTLRRIDPVDGRRAVRLDRGTVPIVANRSDDLTRLLADRGHAVVPATVQLPLETMGVPFEVAHRHYTRAIPAEPRPADEALLAALEIYLDHADRAPASLAFVAMLGLGENRTYVPGELDGGETLLEGELDADPFRLVARPGLLIDVGDALVRSARAMAEDDPQVAAALLGRDVLLAHGRLDDGSDEALTEAALDAVLRLSP